MISIQDVDFSALSPVEKMELADVLYDVAIQESEPPRPLSPEQMRELDRRAAAADRGEEPGEDWEAVQERILRQL
jgi:putative addiction module component (TIGR02574 family)